MNLRVQLEQFEGPLDLLLYLIRKEEMDIFDINIVQITKQYLDFIKLMKEFDLEVAGDFIAMASTLIQIKSRMLLPQYDENGEIVETEDPRKELVQKLLEYEKYKEASKLLYDRPLLNRDQWARGMREKIEAPNEEIELEDNALFSLIGMYRKAMKTLHKRVHKVNVKLQSISNRILEMRDRLVVGKQVTMSELFNQSITDMKEKSRNVLITFLSLLELGKLEYVSLFQTENYGDIYVNTKKPIEDDVVSKAENYDNINADQIAMNLLNKVSIEEFEKDDGLPVQGELNFVESSDNTEESAYFHDDEMMDEEGNIIPPAEELTEEMATDEEIFAAEFEDNKTDIETEGQA